MENEMDDFFETVLFDEELGWQGNPATEEDPDDTEEE